MFYSYYEYSERKKDPCAFYRSTVREPLFLPLFLVVGGKCRETSKRVLSLEILKKIFSSLCKMTANMLPRLEEKVKSREGKGVVKIGCSLKRNVLGIICMESEKDKLLGSV